MDAHTDEGGQQFGSHFTPDESDIKPFDGYGRHEKPGEMYGDGDNNLRHRKDSDHEDNTIDNERQDYNDVEVDNKQDGHNTEINERHPEDLKSTLANEKLRDNEILRNELKSEEEANERHSMNDDDIRKSLHKAEQNDGLQQIHEKLLNNGESRNNGREYNNNSDNKNNDKDNKNNDKDNKNQNNNNNNNHNIQTNDVDGEFRSSERSIKEIHDTIEPIKILDKGHHHIHENNNIPKEDLKYETNKQVSTNQFNIKEQRSLRMSKLIFGGRKTGL